MSSSLRSRSGPRIKYTPDDSPYGAISVDKLTPIIGGEIGGVDLRDPGNRAMDENLVIFFRDQHLTPEQHLDFGRKFGELHLHPAAPAEPAHPELMVIHADRDSPRANGEGWHTDVSCDEPPISSILTSRNVLRVAAIRCSPTCMLPMMRYPTAKTYLGLPARHDGEHYRGRYANYGIMIGQLSVLDHPVVRAHPVTGRKALRQQGFHATSTAFPRRERRYPALSL
jgi:taurine dioxygenase